MALKDYYYDREKYGSIINWDKYSLIIRGERLFICSGEFHYWRVPDRSRWREILLAYKAGGLNTIRIYFHWGFHSPREGKYIFTGNRDIHYLFNLCEELGLYVLCAPGPYICAETSGGGFPGWLLAKTDVRIRHLKSHFRLKFDARFHEYSRQWFANFIPIMSEHELTVNSKGCVIGLQIENEHVQKKVLRFALDEHMEFLARTAREFGATTPLFHNDPMEMGSWVAEKGDGGAGVDLYSFDRYIIWCPRFYYDKSRPPTWKNSNFRASIEGTEKKVRGFGGWAAESPVFIAELQGGWFNQWGHDHGFDEIYDYYGADYTRNVVESFMGEGATMLSMYMYYGGTNWGAIGDPDVYTSYDYSACIREFGYLSDRLRKLRMSWWLARSLGKNFAKTDMLLTDGSENPGVIIEPGGMVSAIRRNDRDEKFIFMRNFGERDESAERENEDFTLENNEGMKVAGKISPRETFILPVDLQGEFAWAESFRLNLTSLPMLARLKYRGCELWVFRDNGGALLFSGADFSCEGNLEINREGHYTRLRFNEAGGAMLKKSEGRKLYLLCLGEESSMTLALNDDLTRLAYGAYGLVFENNDRLNIEAAFEDQEVFYLDGVGSSKTPENFETVEDPVLEGLYRRTFKLGAHATYEKETPLKGGIARTMYWTDPHIESEWKKINFTSERNPLVHNFHSGHVVYRCKFRSLSENLKLSLNTRHRATLWLNGRVQGGHITYGYGPFSAGAKNGVDPAWRGGETYDLSESLLAGEENDLIILTDNLGYNRGPFALNDFRNPRGILSAKFTGKLEGEEWFIQGVDVTRLDDVFTTSGLPGEKRAMADYIFADEVARPQEDANIVQGGEDALTWYRFTFTPERSEDLDYPLRLHLEGLHIAQIYVNGLYCGRYWGDFGPQNDFYIMDGLLTEGENTLVLAVYAKQSGDTTIKSLRVNLLPYKIDPHSGNIDEKGKTFIGRRYHVML